MHIYREADFINPKENISIHACRAVADEPMHTHEFVELVYICTGSATHEIGSAAYDVQRGDLLFIDVGQTHSFCQINDLTYRNILLKPSFISAELIDADNIFDVFTLSAFDDFDGTVESTARKVSFRGAALLEVETLIEQMRGEFEQKRVGYRSVLKGGLQILFAKTLRCMCSEGVHGVEIPFAELMTYIEDNLSQRLTPGDLAARCFYSPSYFCRVFKACYGLSPSVYIRKKRIEKAAQYLCATDYSVEEVIGLVGYSDRKLFFKHFKEQMGKTPKAFRADAQK